MACAFLVAAEWNSTDWALRPGHTRILHSHKGAYVCPMPPSIACLVFILPKTILSTSTGQSLNPTHVTVSIQPSGILPHASHFFWWLHQCTSHSTSLPWLHIQCTLAFLWVQGHALFTVYPTTQAWHSLWPLSQLQIHVDKQDTQAPKFHEGSE